MKNKFTFYSSFSFTIFMFLFYITGFCQNKPLSLITNSQKDSILLAAKTKIHSFIDPIPEANINDYGFNSKSEFDKISFDNPIDIYILQDSLLVFTSTWRVPVVIDGKYAALLTIIKEKGVYQAVDFGAKVLANEIFVNKTPQTVGILRIYELQSDFLIENNTQNQNKYIPIPNNKEIFYNLTDIINMIKSN